MTMKIGLIVPQGWRMDLVGITDYVEAYETMTRVAQEAEALGFDSVWLYDHLHTVPVPTQEVTFECWMSTAALARDTKRVCEGVYAKIAAERLRGRSAAIFATLTLFFLSSHIYFAILPQGR